MPRRKRIRKKSVKKHHPPGILLDRFSAENIQKGKVFNEKYRKYHWDFYKELAYQRSKIADKLKKSLLEASQKFSKIEKWQRVVKYKYTLEPLSIAGSLKDSGGRFNIGDINLSQFPRFPALYLASDKDTALQELLSQKMGSKQKPSDLDPLDFALTRPDSITVISVSGSLSSIINLKEPDTLKPFVDLIKELSIPDYLKKSASEIGEQAPDLIKTVPILIDALQNPHWRVWHIYDSGSKNSQRKSVCH